MKKKYFPLQNVSFLFCFFFLFPLFLPPIFAQQTKLDSLRQRINATEGEEKVRTMAELSKTLYINNPTEGLEIGKQALSLSERLDYDLGRCQALSAIGLNYFATNELSTAKEYFAKSRSISIKIDDKTEIARSYNNLGLIYEKEAKYDSALLVFTTELQLWEQMKDDERIAKTWANIATIYMHQGKMDEAMEYLMKAHKYFEENGKVGDIIGVEIKLSIIYMQTEDYETALKILNGLLERAKSIENKQAIGFVYQNLGVIYRLQTKYAEALENYEKAIVIFEELNDNRQLASIYSNIGTVYFMQNNTDKALEYQQKALEIALQLNSPASVYRAYNNIADIYFTKKDFKAAEKYFLESIKIQKEIGNIFDLPKSYTGIIKTYTATKDFEKAIEMYEEFLPIKDSVYQITMDDELSSLKVEYQTEKIQDENLILQQEGEIQHKKIFIQQLLLFAISFVVLLIGGLAVIIFRNRQKLKVINSILSEKNEEIVTQSSMLKTAFDKLVEVDNFKEGLTQMIVHDLKNPLNSLMNINNNVSVVEMQNSVKQSSKQMLTMVQDMLDVQKYEETKLQLHRKNIPVADLLSRAENEIAFALKCKNINIELQADSNLIVDCDAEIMNRVLVNLLTNAIKYSPSNSSIIINVEVTNNLANFTIQDQGQGIPTEYREKIFEKFVQFNVPKGEKLRSSGLGLTFCKIALESHQQNIHTSECDKGAKFCFSLPYISSLTTNTESSNGASNVIDLSEREKIELKPLLEELQNIQIFKISQLKTILDKVKLHTPSANVDLWCMELYMASVNGNKAYFNILINNALNTTLCKKTINS